MRTECSAEPSAFGRVEGRPVMAAFNGGALTSDAGGLLLGAADRRLNLVRRLAGCFRDARDPRLIEHSVATLIGQRVYGIALGYEDLNDHDELRHDPLMAVLAGRIEESGPRLRRLASRGRSKRVLRSDSPVAENPTVTQPSAPPRDRGARREATQRGDRV